METMKMRKLGSALKWLIPLFAAFFLLFSTGGCVRPQPVPETTAAQTTAEQTTKAAESTAALTTEASRESEKETEAPETAGTEAAETETAETEPEDDLIEEDGFYTSKDEVALYIHTYGWLSDNFLTKKEAQGLGWSGGDLWK